MTFRNVNFVKRDYECSNIVACVCGSTPNDGREWSAAPDATLNGLSKLWTEGDRNGNYVQYWGHL